MYVCSSHFMITEIIIVIIIIFALDRRIFVISKDDLVS